MMGYTVKNDEAKPTVTGPPARRARLIFSIAGSRVQIYRRPQANQVILKPQIQGCFAGLLGQVVKAGRPARWAEMTVTGQWEEG